MTQTISAKFHIGDHVRIKSNAKNTVWESGVIEYIKDNQAFILYGVSRLGDWCGVRGMCTGEDLNDLELIQDTPRKISTVFTEREKEFVPVINQYERD